MYFLVTYRLGKAWAFFLFLMVTLRAAVYTANVLHRFVKLPVATVALPHVFEKSLCTYVLTNHCTITPLVVAIVLGEWLP